MATYKIKAFGITRDYLGARENIVAADVETVAQLRQLLIERHPGLAGLPSLFIAVNNQYAGEETRLRESDEIALIPPVSGG